MTDAEKLIIELMGDRLYTVEFVEEWLRRPSESVFINAPAALQQMGVDGFYTAVRRMAENCLISFSKVVGLERRCACIMVNDPAGREEVENDDK